MKPLAAIRLLRDAMYPEPGAGKTETEFAASIKQVVVSLGKTVQIHKMRVDELEEPRGPGLKNKKNPHQIPGEDE